MQITGLSEKKQKKNKQTQYARIQVNAAAFVKILDEKKIIILPSKRIFLSSSTTTTISIYQKYTYM